MKIKHMSKLNLFLLLNMSFCLPADIDITQKGATSKIIKKNEVFYTGIVKMPTCKWLALKNPSFPNSWHSQKLILKMTKSKNYFEF